MKVWEIIYTQNASEARSIQREFEDKPSHEHAAQQLRDALFQPFIIPETPRNIVENVTVWQLEHLGIKIIDIIEAPAD